MKFKSTIAIASLLLIVGIALVGCGDKNPAEQKSFTQQISDSVADAVADNISESVGVKDRLDTEPPETAQQENNAEPAVAIQSENESSPVMEAVLLDDAFAYGVFEGGLVTFNLKEDEYIVTPVNDHLKAIASHGGSIFVGGDRLYEVQGAELVPVDADIDGCIEVLASNQASLMIGTTEGLYARNILGLFNLMDQVSVTAMAGDGGLWVGTAESGLYRWDGETFKKRYLVRDSSLFDQVKALAFGHNHLYVATADRLFAYDGGRWQEYGVDLGVPETGFSSVDANGWVVYLGSQEGVYSLFENEIKPVGKFNGFKVAALDRQGDKLLVSTEEHGLVLKSGPTIRTLLKPDLPQPEELAVVMH